jgi:hypothetical protein
MDVDVKRVNIVNNDLHSTFSIDKQISRDIGKLFPQLNMFHNHAIVGERHVQSFIPSSSILISSSPINVQRFVLGSIHVNGVAEEEALGSIFSRRGG